MSKYTPFINRSTKERMTTKDDMSQYAFSKYSNEINMKSYKLGVDGSEKYKSTDMNEMLRFSPDKYCIDNSGNLSVFEVKGCKGDLFRIKKHNMEIYYEWRKLFDTYCFVWNSTKQKYAILSIDKLYDIAREVGTTLDVNMGEIYAIPCNLVEWSNLAIIHEPQYADNYNK